MIDLNNVTIVSVAGVRAEQSLKAIKYSCRGLNFGAKILITPENIFDDFVQVINIPPMNYEEYNKFIVYELHKYINTEFALIVQDDGFVINPEKWNNKFLEYDYIGAPFALPKDNFSYRDSFNNLVRVGNGGFSLRSKKILEIANNLNLTWEPFHGYFHEDGFFVCKNRHIYEQEGCKYAPVEIAALFSHEAPTPEIDGIIPFGFHGKKQEFLNKLNEI